MKRATKKKALFNDNPYIKCNDYSEEAHQCKFLIWSVVMFSPSPRLSSLSLSLFILFVPSCSHPLVLSLPSPLSSCVSSVRWFLCVKWWSCRWQLHGWTAGAAGKLMNNIKMVFIRQAELKGGTHSLILSSAPSSSSQCQPFIPLTFFCLLYNFLLFNMKLLLYMK